MSTKIGAGEVGNATIGELKTTPKFALGLSAMYVHLWIVEGAIRKWLPGSEQVLYVARDGMLIIGLVWAGLFFRTRSRRGPVFWVFFVSISLIAAAQVMVGSVPIAAALVGVRSYIAPCLFAYLAWCYGKSDLVPRVARLIALYSPLQMAIAVIQVTSARNSWINKEVGSDAAYFANGLVVRASGTFSAPSGLSLYIPLCLALCLWMIHRPGSVNRSIAILGLVSSSVVTVLSGARGTVLAFSIILVAYLLFQLTTLKGSGLRNAVMVISVALVVVWTALQLLPAVFSSFVDRFENAAESEDTSGRIVGEITDFAFSPFSIFGSGIGNHSAAAIAVGGSGPWVETESLKWVTEMGLFGWTMASLRILACVVFGLAVIFGRQRRNLLTVLLAAYFIPLVLYGQMTQFPSAQASFSICLGLLFVVSRKMDVPVHTGLDSLTYPVRRNGNARRPSPTYT